MSHSSVDGSRTINPIPVRQTPEITQIFRGSPDIDDEYLRESDSNNSRSFVDLPPANTPFGAPPIIPTRDIHQGTYSHAASTQQNSLPSLAPWEHVQPTHYHPAPTPLYYNPWDSIPSSGGRRFTQSDSRSRSYSDISHGHMPSQPPFAVMQGHPVPPWNRYVSVHPFQNHRPSDVFLTSASSLPGATSIHLPPPVSYSSTSTTSAIKPILKVVYIFLFDFLPRQLYLSLLLGLPSLYFTRVARVFEDAELSKPDIKKMVHTTANEWEGRVVLMNWNNTPLLSPALLTFKRSWEEFVDSLMREWKTLNVVSVLLLSAILTVLQIQGAGNDPVTRTVALMSLICALMSLTYGCIFIVRFGTMKKMHKASSWADEARKTDTLIWWNVWVLLAMPAVWLAWSMVLFLSCILSFIWRTGSVLDPPDRSPLMPDAAFGVRVGISGVLALGFVYAIMIVKTLRRYGARMDEAWTNRALAWQMENVPYPATPYHRRSIYRPNKPGPIYGTRTRLPLYRPEREDDARSDIELGSTRFSTIPSQTRTPDGRVTGGPPMPQEERSALFSNSVIPELINDAGQSVRPSTPPASRPVLPSEADHIPRLPTPLPSVVPIPNPPDQPDSFIIPTLFFRLANLPAMRPAFPTMKIQDNMANFQETVPSIPSELDLYYDVYADEWSRFLHDLSLACTGRFPVSAGVQVNQSDLIADLIDVWNNAFFYARDIGVSIVEDEAISSSPPGTGGTKYTLYLNCAPAEQPVRGPGYFESNRLSPITERTEPSLAGNRSLERPSGIFIPELT